MGQNDSPDEFTVAASFTPAADITAFELALILARTVPLSFRFLKNDWEGLDPEIKRHFSKIE